MFEIIEKNERALFDLLTAIPPKFDETDQYLLKHTIEKESLTKIALAYINESSFEYSDIICEKGFPPSTEIIHGLHSTYICEVLELLFKYGLEANREYDDTNILMSLFYIDNEYIGADAAKIVIDHGGDPNKYVCEDSAFTQADFDVFFEAIEQYNRQRFSSLIHYWMVLLAYGGKTSNYDDRVTLFREYDSPLTFNLAKLQNHRQYYYGLTHIEETFAVSIYDKNTMWEVARIIKKDILKEARDSI